MLINREQYATVAKCLDPASRATCSKADVEMALQLLGIKHHTEDPFAAIENAVKEQDQYLTQIIGDIIRLQSEGKRFEAYIYAVDNLGKVRSVYMFENVLGGLLHDHPEGLS